MNTRINRNTRSKSFRLVSIAMIAFVSTCSLLAESAFGQQAMNSVTGTVVRVRLVPTLTPTQGAPFEPPPLPDLVEVGVQGTDGETYEAIANRAHQPRLGTEVLLVNAGGLLRVAQ